MHGYARLSRPFAMLHKFSTPARVAIVGSSGGIGRGLVSRLTDDPAVGHIYALARTPKDYQHPAIDSLVLDFDSEATIAKAASRIAKDGPLDLVVIASGILHQGDDIRPEKSMAEIDARKMSALFAINTVGPTLVAKHLLPLMRSQAHTVFAALSARVGSIGDNRLGGWLSYRASKAALNMAVKTLSVEQSRKRPQSIIVGLHPGTVDTALSQPFTRRVAERSLFTPDEAAGHLLSVIDGLAIDDSGGFFAWDGKPIPF